jgi:hypothetical protein
MRDSTRRRALLAAVLAYLFVAGAAARAGLLTAYSPDTNGLATAVVFGGVRTAYAFGGDTTTGQRGAPAFGGTHGAGHWVIPSDYTVELTFEFTERATPRVPSPGGENRQPGASPHVVPRRGPITAPPGIGGGTNGEHHEVVVTASWGGTSVYRDGVLQLSLPGATMMLVDSPQNLVELFLHDTAGGYSSGEAASIRIYKGQPTAGRVSALDSDLAPAPEPATLVGAATAVVLGVGYTTWRSRRRTA